MNPRLLREALNIRPGEGIPIALMGAYSFLIGIFLAYFISLANAFFLAEFGVDYLPHGYIATGIVGYLAGAALTQLQRRLPLRSLLFFALTPPLVLTVVYRVGSAFVPDSWLAFAMFISIGPFITLLYFVFRSLAGYLFDLRQGKRLFGLISSGDVISSIIGFFSVPLLLGFFSDVADLLLLAAFALFVCLFVLRDICRRYADRLGLADVDEEDKAEGSFTELVRQRYFVWLFLLSAAAICGFYYIDYAFLGQLRVRFEDKAYLAQFISLFYGIIRIIELVFKTFLSGRLLGQYGLRFGLVSMPALLLACVGLALFADLVLEDSLTLLFLLMAFAKLIERVLTKSLYDPSFNILYQPLNAGLRLAVQTKVEGIVQPLAVALAGVTLLFLGRYGSFDLVVAILAVLLVLWLAAALRMYREYRQTLLSNLAGQRRLVDENIASDASCVELLAETLASEEPAVSRRALGLYERLAPGRAGAAAIGLLEHGEPLMRLEALDVLTRVGTEDLHLRLERLAVEDGDEEVRARAREVLAALPAAEVGDIESLTRSPKVAERVLAARLCVGRGAEASVWLEMLLRDVTLEVRQAALIAIDGESGTERLWAGAAEILPNTRLAPAAAAALRRGGEAVLAVLESQAASLGPHGVGRAARVYGEIGGPKAQALLLEKLAYPDKDVRTNVLSALRLSGYRAGEEEAPRFRQFIIEEAAVAAWAIAGILDMGEAGQANGIRAALGQELDMHRERIFLLLALLYEPRYIRLVRESFKSGSADGKVYALELVDVFLHQELKGVIFPLLEELPLAGRLRRMEHDCPQQSLEPIERLKNIANSDYALSDRWTKACAVAALGDQGQVFDEQIAHLFNPDPLLSQTAAWHIYRNDAAEYRRASAILAPKVRAKMDQDLEQARAGGAPHLLVDQVGFLKSTDLLNAVPEYLLVEIARRMSCLEVEAGAAAGRGRGRDDMYLVHAGRLVGADGTVAGPGQWIGGLNGDLAATPPQAAENSLVFTVKRHVLDDLAADHLAAAAGLVQAQDENDRKLGDEGQRLGASSVER
jgi:ATP:ADP antiporter, AAA family